MFYIAAGGFAAGIFAGTVWGVGYGVALALVEISGALFFVSRAARSAARDRLPAFASLASVACLCCALGIARFEIAAWNERDALFDAHVGERVEVEGVISREPDERASATHLALRVERLGDAPARRLVLVVTDRFPEFRYGERVVVAGTLKRPEAFETDLGRVFDYPGYLSARGIAYTLPFARVEKIGEGEGNVAFALLLRVKRAFMGRIEVLLPEPQAGLAEGLVLGAKRALGKELEEAFRTSGIIHIVVLSGYNITIVVEAVMRALAFLRPRLRAGAGALAIAAFTLMVGLSATALRAALMALLVLLARATGRTYDVLRALIVAGVAMVLWNPRLLVFDPGFQLSFLATLGLILVAPLIERRLSLVPTRFQIREFLTATLATQLFVLPLLLYSMGTLSLVAVVVNVLTLPAVPLTMLLVFLSGAVGFIGETLALPVAFASHVLLSYIIAVAERFAALPFAALSVHAFPFWVVALAYACMALLLWRVSAHWHIAVPRAANEYF